ncbi:glycosyltransferase family 39 protein [Tolypothrix sp. VBCCA 56010]|uniref:glycosyltransferase family 39 protein n=1 Tax=Tolypothrix sp. VBCCA 56010 TaxID=3137731 RepID=UPI003D7E7A52
MHQFKLAPSWLRFLIVVLLAIGIFFRFVNLERKVYWHDETYTSLRISGYTVKEVKQQIFNNRVITGTYFDKYQRLNPEKKLGDTIKSLAIEDPQHPPLYYIIARFWVQIFGNSVTAIRSLSAFISLLVFPCVYWLCKELFRVPLSVPFIAIALMAISPIHLVYAQEAREYMLWTVTILLSSASLLRAIRLESKNKELAKKQQASDSIIVWGIYAATLTLGLYTFLLSGFVALAHAIYVLATAKFQFNKTVKNYLFASLAGFLAFMPWILVVLFNFYLFNLTTAWTKTQINFINLIQAWLIQLSHIFFDFNFGFENPLSYFITPVILIFVGYAIYFLYRTTNEKSWLFIVLLIAVPALPLILPDLLFGGIRSLSDRYFLPSYLGIQIAVAYLLATQIYNGNLARRQIWQIITVLVITCGMISCGVNSQAETWWSKVISYGNPQVATIINQASRPLLISDSFGINYGNVFSLSYLLEPKVRFQLVKEQNTPKISNQFTDIFLLNPANDFRKKIEKSYKSKLNVVYKDNYYSLWKLVKYQILRRRNISHKIPDFSKKSGI